MHSIRWWGLAGVLLLAGILLWTVPARATEPRTYLGFYGFFDKAPFAIVAKEPGAAVTLRRDLGIRQVPLDPAFATRLLPTMIPLPRADISGVAVYTDPRGKGVEVSYPAGAPPTLDLSEPTDLGHLSPGHGGGEGDGGGGGGGGGM
jgi:hypothetical protein